MQYITQSFNQPITHLINESANQSTNPSIIQSISQATNQPISQSINLSINQSISQSITVLLCQRASSIEPQTLTVFHCDLHRCDRPCENGKYGPQCLSKCSCNLNNSICNVVDGSCNCTKGWTGDTCNTPCGVKNPATNTTIPCEKTCNCTEHGSCQTTTGKCL